MNRQMNQKSGAARRPGEQRFTEKQGQYLAFIYAYLRMFRCSPAETDMQRHFQVSPPASRLISGVAAQRCGTCGRHQDSAINSLLRLS